MGFAAGLLRQDLISINSERARKKYNFWLILAFVGQKSRKSRYTRKIYNPVCFRFASLYLFTALIVKFCSSEELINKISAINTLANQAINQ